MDILLILLIVLAVLAIAGGVFITPWLWILVIALLIVFVVTRVR